MKKTEKRKTKFWLFSITIIGVFAAGYLLLFANSAQAQIEFKPQVNMGRYQVNEAYPVSGSTAMIGDYIREIYKYAIGAVGILAVVVMMFGGISWIAAGGNAERVAGAKAWIGASLTGLVLALASYVILATVNPALVNFRVREIADVERTITCCHYSQGVQYSTDNRVCPPDAPRYNSSTHACRNEDGIYRIIERRPERVSNCCSGLDNTGHTFCQDGPDMRLELCFSNHYQANAHCNESHDHCVENQ